MRADGLEQRRLTRTRTLEGAPSWSPDGLSLAFYRVTGGRADLWVAGADGRAARRLIRRAGNEVDPTWSPDGATIAFASDRRGRWTIDTVPRRRHRPHDRRHTRRRRLTSRLAAAARRGVTPLQAAVGGVGRLRHADSWHGDLREDMGSGDGVFGVAGGAFLELG
jgi:dipeptidyl aminopeptidase/acylaminoacyl peptidase